MDIIEESFQGLYDPSRWVYEAKLTYSGHFTGYNANIKLRGGRQLTISMSRAWKDVSREIKIGLIQTLLLKLLKSTARKADAKKTTQMDLYNHFMRSLHLSVEKTEQEPELCARFDILNDAYFNGMLDKSNLAWGDKTFRKLGHYDFGKDMIVLSSILRGQKDELIDYVLYHEMLHKKLKFRSSQGSTARSSYHTHEFKELEKRFPNAAQLEKELSRDRKSVV
jgi:predicted metal-dependent hydrolase